ncbi:hypothetical protein MMC07_001378 [Pseudocyphellaria aurata]|nr:hypothetical protein [Pseudocyphellaria aurata]
MSSSKSLSCSPLLSLPLEIRLDIYSYLNLSGHNIILDNAVDIGLFSIKEGELFCLERNRLDAGILLVNQQLNTELAPMLYSKNRFDFDHPLNVIFGFLGKFRRETRALIREMRIVAKIPVNTSKSPWTDDSPWAQFCHLLEDREQSFQLHRLIIYERYGAFPDDWALVERLVRGAVAKEVVIEASNEKRLGEILGALDRRFEVKDRSEHGEPRSLWQAVITIHSCRVKS